MCQKRLKTPPATPLFPSLEMEPGPQLVLQKEIPISQAISRVSHSTFRDFDHNGFFFFFLPKWNSFKKNTNLGKSC